MSGTRPRLLAAIASVLLMTACDHPVRPEIVDEPPDLAGTYVLHSIDGEPLPVLRYRSEPYDTEIHYVDGSLALRVDSTFHVRYVVRYTRGTLGGRVPPGAEETIELTGRYSVSLDSLHYRFRSGGFEMEGGLPHPGGSVVEAPTDGAATARFARSD